MKTAAIYARFSSDMQKDRSVDDQFADCEALAKSKGFKVVDKFSDRAKSGASLHGRPGARALLLAAKARKFDVVIVESFSRLARDKEDIAHIYKRLKHADIELHAITKMSAGKRFVTCAAAYQRSACSHGKAYIMDTLKDLVLDGMRNRLTEPKALARAAQRYHAEYAAQSKKEVGERNDVEKQRNRLEIKIARLVAAISDSDEPLPALLASLKTKETERVGLEERLKQIKATSNVVALHPNVLKDYRANVEKLHQSFMRNPDSQENRLAFHNMIDSIVVHPTAYREPYEVSVYGRLSAILGVDLFPTARSNAEIIAAEGLHHRSDNDHPD